MRIAINWIILLVAVIFATSCNKKNAIWTLPSPDGNLKVLLAQKEDLSLHFSVQIKRNGVFVNAIETSQLGVRRHDTEFLYNLELVGAISNSNLPNNYKTIKGKRLTNECYSNEIVLTFKNQDKKLIEIIFQAFNDGIGFRYRFPEKSGEMFVVEKELTEFTIPTNGFAWIQPYDTLGIWSPSYEYGYMQKMKIGTPPPLSTGWGFPALFETNGLWLLLTETGLNETYCGSHLSANCDSGLYKIEYPFEWENYGMWKSHPQNTLPWETPWRVIIIGENPGTIVESNLTFHLAQENQIGDISWVKPGISSWNWWGDHSGGWKSNSLKEYIDFSAEMGWPYSLIDAEWHVMQGGSLEELAEYAKSKNVGLFIWYNSGGPHTKVMDAGPKDLMFDRDVRRKEMKRISDLGIKGIKVDFFQSDKQGTINLYVDIIKDAADFQLMVNTHGSTIPRGWDRTYPNLITMEAVRGAELYSSTTYPPMAVWQNTILPFTRNVIGSMDYTPVTFSDFSPQHIRMTTNAHELALSVIFESGVQHFADRVESFRKQPNQVTEFLKDVPVTWDDTRFISGYPEEQVILARTKDDIIYIAGLNGTMEQFDTSFSVPFIKPDTQYSASIIMDGENSRNFNFSEIIISANDKLNISMLPAGGFVAKIKLLKN